MSTTQGLVKTQAASGVAVRGSSKKTAKGRGGGNQNIRGGRPGRANGKTPASVPAVPAQVLEEKEKVTETTIEADAEEVVCWICAEPVKYYSVSECNHRTCHVCALRLRALYKKTDCTFCKEPQLSVIFTVSADALFSSYMQDSLVFKDAKLSIYFETQEMMEETLILLRFNCPDPDCAYIGSGWGDLKLHVRATHGKLMCDLCIRSKKVFAHEHALYPPNMLSVHLPSMYRPHGKSVPSEQIEGGIHPLCEFCRECFFSDDELYAHMRERHEECFICKRNEVRDQYFLNYESLETHFNRAHHPCTNSECLARKFVVFNTPLDLQAHMVEEHGSDMSARDKRDARRIQAEFEFEEVGIGGRHGRRDRGHRDRDREPPPHQRNVQQEHPPPSAPPPQPGIVRPPGPGRRREGFGTNLTFAARGNPSPPNDITPEPSRPPSPPRGDVDPAITERHAAFMARLQSLVTNPTTAVPVVKAAIRGYRASESSAKDLILTIWNVLDQNLEHTASIVNAFVDILDQEDKKQDLLSSWKGFVIEQRRDFPDLIPTAIATGSAPYAAITTGRVLNAKHVTATRSSQRSSRQVWDRVAQAAGSSLPTNQTHAARPVDRFPALPASSGTGPSSIPAHRQGQHTTPWSASASSGFRAAGAMPTPAQASSTHLTVIPNPNSKPPSGRSTPQQPPPKLSSAVFPELPSAASTRQKAQVSGNVSLRNILGNPTPPSVPAWGSGGANPNSPATQAAEGDGDSAPSLGPGKGKKGKGKQKQTLFTLGSFPS